MLKNTLLKDVEQMTQAWKIITFFINLLCCVVTLAYPGKATPYALIPSIITSVAWVFSSQKEIGCAGKRIIALVSFFGFMILFCGMTAEISITGNRAEIVFFKEVFLLGEAKIDYLIFAIISIIAFLIPALSELASLGMSENVEDSKTLDDMVENEMKNRLKKTAQW